jgi:hypothetical protein
MEQARIFIAIALSFVIFIPGKYFLLTDKSSKRQLQIVSEEDPNKKEAQVYIPKIKEKNL